jgi:4-hydroxy-2-oxoheptanedioate aldolase
MERGPNKLRQKLAKGYCATGTAVFSWSPNIIDAIGFAGLDFVRIDNEHAWRQDSSMEHLVRAAVMGDVVPLVRVDRDNPSLIRKALEIGAGGIIVPDVCTVEEAEAVVQASKFPPRGTRGYSGNCWSAGWGTMAGAGWVQWSDSEPMIGIMIENVKAMDRVDDILAVEGIDFTLFGPADYSMSLGLEEPRANDERVQEALARTVAAARKAGKHVALGVGLDPKTIRKYVDLGITMLELGNDLGIVRSAWERTKGAVAEITG